VAARWQWKESSPSTQQEIVRRTFWRRFDIPICRCQKCDKQVQGRDPRQTSDALGAAAAQLGSEALGCAPGLEEEAKDGSFYPTERSAVT